MEYKWMDHLQLSDDYQRIERAILYLEENHARQPGFERDCRPAWD